MEHCERCQLYCIPYCRYEERYSMRNPKTYSFRTGMRTFVNDFGFTNSCTIPILSFCEWLEGIISFLECIKEKAKPDYIVISELFEYIQEGHLHQCCFMNFLKNMGMQESPKYINYLCLRMIMMKNLFLKESKKHKTIGDIISHLVYEHISSYSSEDSSEDERRERDARTVKKSFSSKKGGVHMKVVREESPSCPSIQLQPATFYAQKQKNDIFL